MNRVQLQTRLEAYLAAEAGILRAQEYAMGQSPTARRLARADLGEVRQAIVDIRAEVSQLDASTVSGGRRVFYLRPF